MLPPRYRQGCLGLAIALACAAAHGAPIPYATEHVIAADDTPAAIVAKAATTLPRPNQSAWMRLERTFFLHFGVNTFNEVEWGNGKEDPALFNPAQLDAHQWLRAVKQLDGKMLVLVAKHHDGFAMWPSRYTAHSSAASPWRGGKGDLVREVADAARAAGVKLGIYLSPADLYQLKTNPANPAGFDNSSDSLVMSPALLNKYLQAAREVSSHLVLQPAGFTFAPHPMLAESDRGVEAVAHDPTQLNRQGPDTGTSYRSEIFATSPVQAATAKAYIAQLDAEHVFAAPIVTKVEPLKGFYRAEGYHQDYLVRNPNQPYIRINDLPKIAALAQVWPQYYRNEPVLLARN